MIKAIIVIVAVLLLYLTSLHTNLGFVQIVDIDDYAFHGTLLGLFEGFSTLSLKGMSHVVFASYGYTFWLLCLALSAPFFVSGDISMTIWMPRLVAAASATLALVFIYKIGRLYLDRLPSSLLVLFAITMPAFWQEATRTHPDWTMTLFLIISVYFFSRDDNDFSRNYWFAVAAFGMAVGTKIQAVTFLPLLLAYIFHREAAKLDFSLIKKKLWLAAKSLLVVIALFFANNFNIFHPRAARQFVFMFKLNMWSNATNHGQGGVVTIHDKIRVGVESNYFDKLFFALIALIALYYIYRYFRDEKAGPFHIIGISFIANIGYLFFFVNKAWPIYYLSAVYLGILLFIPLLRKAGPKTQTVLLSVAIIVQLYGYSAKYPEFATRRFDEVKYQAMSDFIVETLEGHVTGDTKILMSRYTAFEFERLGLGYRDINMIWGPLRPKRLRGNSFLIIRKDDVYFKPKKLAKMTDQEGYRLGKELIASFMEGKGGFEPFAENEKLFFFKRSGDGA